MNKYRAKKQVVDGHTFDSKAEARRYGELKILQRARCIDRLKVHPKFRLDAHGVQICTYTADFQYLELDDTGASTRFVVEDVKSAPTARRRDYILTKKLFMANNPGIDFREVMK